MSTNKFSQNADRPKFRHGHGGDPQLGHKSKIQKMRFFSIFSTFVLDDSRYRGGGAKLEGKMVYVVGKTIFAFF